MKMRKLREEFVPWAGLTMGLVAISIAHQFGSEGSFNDCAAVAPLPILLVALAAILVTVVAALLSWRVVTDAKQGPARRLIALVSVGTAALFVFATILPMIAALVLPPCFQ